MLFTDGVFVGMVTVVAVAATVVVVFFLNWCLGCSLCIDALPEGAELDGFAGAVLYGFTGAALEDVDHIGSDGLTDAFKDGAKLVVF